jgi:hypothetical protein
MSYLKYTFYIFLMQLISIRHTAQKKKILEKIMKNIGVKPFYALQNNLLPPYKEYTILLPLQKNKNTKKIEGIILRKSGRF